MSNLKRGDVVARRPGTSDEVECEVIEAGVEREVLEDGSEGGWLLLVDQPGIGPVLCREADVEVRAARPEPRAWNGRGERPR